MSILDLMTRQDRGGLRVTYIGEMALRRKNSSASDGVLEVFSTGHGLVVQGTTTGVAAFIDEMMAATRASGGRGRHLLVDVAIGGGEAAANAVAYRQAHREYFEFSERALALLREHGPIPTTEGWFRSFVHDGRHLAGHLDWKPVHLGPEQALNLQVMAGQMALRAAIRDVVAAIERVEDKVDRIAELARAERLGAVAADRATLHPMATRLRTTGRVSTTDWGTVASLGPWIARDIESLRSYIVQQVQKVGDSRLVRSRAADAEDLADQLVAESLALLVVAEQNYALWQELRIGHAAVHERSALDAVASDVREQLVALTRADQALADRLSRAVQQLASPTGYEGLAPLKKRQLMRQTKQLATMRTWFAEQRHLDYDETDLAHLPGLGESLSKVGRVVATSIRSLADGSDDAAATQGSGIADGATPLGNTAV